MKRLLLLLTLTAGLFSCQQKATESEAVTKLEGEVMAVHDAVMPKMEEIMSLQSELRRQADADSLIRPRADSLSRLLNEADNAMSDWMAEYQTEAVRTLPPAEAKTYLESEMRKIKDVQARTDESIAAAKAFLKK
jgi:hypothetical protein